MNFGTVALVSGSGLFLLSRNDRGSWNDLRMAPGFGKMYRVEGILQRSHGLGNDCRNLRGAFHTTDDDIMPCMSQPHGSHIGFMCARERDPRDC